MVKFVITLADAVENEVIKPSELKSYLEGKIKVDGKTGNLGAGGVEVLEGDEDVTVNAEKISKRYLKYLTRRFLHSIKMRDYLRIVSSGKDTYAIKLVKVGGDEGEEEE